MIAPLCRFARPMLLLLLLAHGPALAHATKESTTPPDGATLTASPTEIAMRFDAPIRVTFLRIVDGDGVEQALTRENGAAHTQDVRAIPGPLGPGRYTVEWRGLADDGHAMQGQFSFEILD